MVEIAWNLLKSFRFSSTSLQRYKEELARTLRIFHLPAPPRDKDIKNIFTIRGLAVGVGEKNKEESKRKKNMKELRPRKGPSKPLKSV